MNSFYLNHSVNAEYAEYDVTTMTVRSKFLNTSDMYIEEHARMDPANREFQNMEAVFDSDEARKSLLQRLNVKSGQTCDDVQSGASALTGDSETSGASSVRSETSMGFAIGRTASLRMNLAKANRDAAEKDYEMRKLKEQIEALMAEKVSRVDEPQGKDHTGNKRDGETMVKGVSEGQQEVPAKTEGGTSGQTGGEPDGMEIEQGNEGNLDRSESGSISKQNTEESQAP
jgi:hypothetical protein